ncbi:MotA/TolQ/ExbB proton channel family protein [Candidatus Magnetobacterium casense]|uniref:MotA/TolQ/ExbB proton channel family protein n=1 Tax=Candidatus Magnetobacterium casense TaxID=1455061 RepID=A0ABS6RYL7_9BACT|nr:MotA/TolQ/ExbB proton channel family protein [Candidatus Magnetobacterium casensis]MBV6341288.1 MotA/TolQ/ExbB proton channel family protein [Candidatus Magnetobacterium casensis]
MDQKAFSLVLQAGVVVKLVLVTLLLFSGISWGIILTKWRLFSKARGETLSFLRYFKAGKEAAGLNKVARACTLSPVANIYRSVYEDRDIEGIDGLRRAVRRYSSIESARIEKYLAFLATTGSTTPFIGLFGTVWGIMNSFMGIGSVGSASLAVVAPGIAEALIATAAGLAAAIPAVMGYNFFLSTVRTINIEMDDFAEDLVAFFQGMMDEDRKR